MNVKKLFIKELSFLAKEYGFEFVEEFEGVDEKYAYKKSIVEIGFKSKTSQFDNTYYFYYSKNGWRTKIDIDYEYEKLFGKKVNKNYFWQLKTILREQLKESKIFNNKI